MPSFKGQLTRQQIADVAAYVSRTARRLILLPDGFPRDVGAFALRPRPDADWEDGLLRPRTRAAIARPATAGVARDRRHGPHVLGSARTSSRPGSPTPSSATRAPSSRSRRPLLLHEPIELELARRRSRRSATRATAELLRRRRALRLALTPTRGVRGLPAPPDHAVGDLSRGSTAADEARRRRRPTELTSSAPSRSASGVAST